MRFEIAGSFFRRLFCKSGVNHATEEAKKKKELQQLVDGVKNACREWTIANINFNNTREKDLVDYYAYEMKAAEIKIGYFLKLIKKEKAKMLEKMHCGGLK